MMVLVALLLMPWFGTKVVLSRPVLPPFRLIVDSCYSAWSSWISE